MKKNNRYNKFPEKKKNYSPKRKNSVREKVSYEELSVLSALKKHGEKKVASKILYKQSRIKDKKVFYNLLHQMEENGKIKVDKNHKVKLLPKNKGMQATLVSLSAGFGFARPDDGGEDVFIHGSALNGAFPGDKLILTDVNKREKGLEGKIKTIAERSNASVIGTVKITENGVFIRPDSAIRYDLKADERSLKNAKDGDKVVFEPKQDRRGDWTGAKILSVVGSGDVAKICADSIIIAQGIPTDFSETVLEEAEIAAAKKITQIDIAQRIDLRDELIFTIDGADAKDLDDAICVKKTKSGYQLGVHIADVSHYIKEETELDKEAFARGTSVYFADRVIPMLPKAISNGICSLTDGEDKLAFSAIIDFDEDGEIDSFKFAKSIIHSKVHGIYDEVNQIFAGTASEEITEKYAPVKKSLENAKELSDILTRREKERGTMEISSGEIKFVLDEKGVCVDIKPRKTGKAEHLIEQMMISANIAAAKFGQKNNLPFVFRVHDVPQSEKLQSLIEILDRLMIPCSEIKKTKPKPADFGAVLERVKNTGKEELVSQRVLRTMEKAKYSDEETGHFGLALADYSHFTSPIRRYPDLSIHRIMSAFLSGMPEKMIQKKYAEFADKAAGQSTKTEIRAVTAERSAEDCYVAEYMRAHIGEKHVGIISGATARGLFVRLKNGAEGFVSIDAFKGDYLFDGVISHADRTTKKALTVGDEVAIIVASSDVASGRVDFMPNEE